MRQQFIMRYPDVRWLADDKCLWSGHCRQAEVIDFLTFEKFAKSITIKTLCRATINKKDEVKISFEAKTNSGKAVSLPLGTWKQFDQDNTKEDIYKVFELEVKILIDIFYREKYP